MDTIGSITLTIREGQGVTLTVTGPAAPVGPLTVRPTVGVQRDHQGRYHFVIGNNDSVISPAQLPQQIRSALQRLGSGQPAATRPGIRMPSCTDLLRDGRQNTAPRFITHAEYNNRRVSRLIAPGASSWWPVMSRPEYEGYCQLCRLFLSKLSAPRR